MADILGMMDYIGRRTDQGVQTGKQNRLAGLYQQALQGPRDQRSGLIAQMAGVSPQAAFDAEKHFGGMDDNARQRLGQYAAAFDALPDDQKPTAYPQLAAQAQELGIPAPSQWDPSYAPNIQKLALTLSGGTAGIPSGVREFQYMTQGLGGEDVARARRVALGLDGRASNAGLSTIEVENDKGGKDRYTFDPRKGTYVRFSDGMGAVQPPANQNADPNQVFASLHQSVPGLRVTSGLRTLEENASLPNSVPNSYHLTGQAIDVGTPSPEQRQRINAWAAQNGYEVIDNYSDGHVHIEPRGASSGSPRPGVGMLPADRKFAEESGQQAAQLATLGQRGEIEARNAAAKALAEEEARAMAAQQFGSPATREAAVEARKKLPQLNNAVRGITRIEQALESINKGMLGDTGPVDQVFQRYTKDGQELEAAVGAIQNSILALTRVPGVGSQSDLEQRVAMLQYPSLDKAPEVNARTIANLRLFMQDLQDAYQQVTGGQQGAPSNSGGTGGAGKRLKFNPATGRIE